MVGEAALRDDGHRCGGVGDDDREPQSALARACEAEGRQRRVDAAPALRWLCPSADKLDAAAVARVAPAREADELGVDERGETAATASSAQVRIALGDRCLAPLRRELRERRIDDLADERSGGHPPDLDR